MRSLTLICTILLLAAAGCKTAEESTKNGESGRSGTSNEPIFDLPPEVVEAYLMEEMTESERLLFETRSSLSDQFVTVEQEIPDAFLKDIEQIDDESTDQYAGFRVQLLSTRSVVEADSTKDHFRVWADEHIDGYAPEAYVIFRQPYYKVRVGDFRNQQRANEFSRMLKEEYPSAWVVHDRIEPQYIPADTTDIRKVDL